MTQGITNSLSKLLLYDSLGLAEPGKAHELVRRKDNTYGGRYLVNPSGGYVKSSCIASVRMTLADLIVSKGLRAKDIH